MTFTYHYNQSFKVKNSRCLLPINYREENCRHLSVNVQNHKETVSKRAPILDEREREREKSLSGVRLFVIPWTAAYQGPPPMGFSRQAYWSGVPFPPPS